MIPRVEQGRRVAVEQFDLRVAFFSQTIQKDVVILIGERSEFADAKRNAMSAGIIRPRRNRSRPFRSATRCFRVDRRVKVAACSPSALVPAEAASGFPPTNSTSDWSVALSRRRDCAKRLRASYHATPASSRGSPNQFLRTAKSLSHPDFGLSGEVWKEPVKLSCVHARVHVSGSRAQQRYTA